jgi:hypothetical protein
MFGTMFFSRIRDNATATQHSESEVDSGKMNQENRSFRYGMRHSQKKLRGGGWETKGCCRFGTRLADAALMEVEADHHEDDDGVRGFRYIEAT